MSGFAHTTGRKATEKVLKGFFNNIRNPMKEANKINSTILRAYSPLSLNYSWPIIWRMTLILFVTGLGIIINGFFVASFFIESPLRTRGNVYLACTGLADLILTGAVMPTIAVILLSGQPDSQFVCHGIQTLAQTSTYCYSLFFMLVAFETYFRITSAEKIHKKFILLPIVAISCAVFIISFIVSWVGVYYELDYDYCKREHFGHLRFRLISLVCLHMLPFTATISLFYCTLTSIKTRPNAIMRFRKSGQLKDDYCFTKLKIWCYVFFVAAWIPYHVVVYAYPATSDANFYYSAWFGVVRSLFTSIGFSGWNVNFHNAFSRLYNYCCCKNSIAAPKVQRYRRRQKYRRAKAAVAAANDMNVQHRHCVVSYDQELTEIITPVRNRLLPAIPV